MAQIKLKLNFGTIDSAALILLGTNSLPACPTNKSISHPWCLMHNLKIAIPLMFVAISAALAQTDPAPKPLAEIRAGLASLDFQTRETAQQDLAKVPPGQIDILRAVAENERDPEVQSRLRQRLEEMKTYFATHPENISLDLRDAQLSTVIAGPAL
jgi:hypothetical protein